MKTSKPNIKARDLKPAEYFWSGSVGNSGHGHAIVEIRVQHRYMSLRDDVLQLRWQYCTSHLEEDSFYRRHSAVCTAFACRVQFDLSDCETESALKLVGKLYKAVGNSGRVVDVVRALRGFGIRREVYDNSAFDYVPRRYARCMAEFRTAQNLVEA